MFFILNREIFSETRGLFRSWRSAFWRSSMKSAKLDCIGRTGSKLPANAAFVCD
jgi:hypothetical protein